MTHNVYFDGQVQSLGFNSADGRATVGVITAGRYAFSTESEERVIIIAGQLRVRLPGEEWKVVRKDENYIVARDSSFEVKTNTDAAYICYYR